MPKGAVACTAETSRPSGRQFTPRFSADFLIRLASISRRRAKCMSAGQMSYSGYTGDGFISPETLSNKWSALRMVARVFNTTLWMPNTCRKLRQISGTISRAWSSTRRHLGSFQSSQRDCREIAITLITPRVRGKSPPATNSALQPSNPAKGAWIMSVFWQAVVYLLVALPAVAQSQAFARITIKPARPADPRNARVQVLPNGDLIASAPVGMLLSYAYDVPVNPSPRLSGLPDWAGEKYDIEAKAPANAVPPSPQDSSVRGRI